MKGGAIESEKLNQLNISRDQLIKEKIHSVKIPTKYNFLELEIPDEIKNSIEIVPSDHNKDVDSQFFDFQLM